MEKRKALKITTLPLYFILLIHSRSITSSGGTKFCNESDQSGAI